LKNSNSVIFENFFLKFSKMLRAVPLQPIWTIMVAAKLDHSRVLVTKVHQNRSTLKGRSAGQRHTDRQTQRQTRLTSRLVITARLRPQFRMPPVRGSVVRIRGMMRTLHFWIHTSLSSTVTARRHTASILPLHSTIGGRLPEW